MNRNMKNCLAACALSGMGWSFILISIPPAAAGIAGAGWLLTWMLFWFLADISDKLNKPKPLDKPE